MHMIPYSIGCIFPYTLPDLFYQGLVVHGHQGFTEFQRRQHILGQQHFHLTLRERGRPQLVLDRFLTLRVGITNHGIMVHVLQREEAVHDAGLAESIAVPEDIGPVAKGAEVAAQYEAQAFLLVGILVEIVAEPRLARAG